MKTKLTKIALVLVCFCIIATTVIGSGFGTAVYAETGNAISADTFATTEDKWLGAKTQNLIPTPDLPSLNTGDGKDVSKWKSNWNKAMVGAGWGSAYISGDDDALQVYAATALDGSATFAIRPAKSGTFGGGDACLGGAGNAPTKYTGGISYTVELSAIDQEVANAGKLRTSAKAEFYREFAYRYYFALTVEFLDADGNALSTQNKTWTDLGATDGYLGRALSAQSVPAGTVYIRYWFSNNGVGNARKAVKNMQAYLYDDSRHDSDHNGLTFEIWRNTESLPTEAGNYALTADVTLSSAYTPVDGVNLCLNGYKIIQGSDASTVEVASGVTFAVYDCTEAGCITHADGKVGKGVVISGGTFNLYGGKITQNGSATTTERGSGVLVESGTFNMYGGEICENMLGGARGAGVSVGNTKTDTADATFNMYGGEIYGNTVGMARGSAVSIGGATTDGKYLFYFNMYGGKIYANTTSESTLAEGEGDADAVVVDKNGRFVMSGGEISGNRNGVYVTAGVATLSGTAVIHGNGSSADAEKGGTYGYNLRLGASSTESRYLTVGGKFSDGAIIGVSVASGHDDQISSGKVYINNTDHSDADALNYIYCEDNTQKLYYDSESSCIKIKDGHAHAGAAFTPWTAVSGDAFEGNYYLEGDMTATGNITVPSGNTVTLCLNGHTLDMGEYSVINNGVFEICDCRKSAFEESGSIEGTQAAIENNGALSLDGGNVESLGNSAIRNNSGASLDLSRGNVSSSTSSAIANNGGTVETAEGTAVSGSEGDELPPHTHEGAQSNFTELTAAGGELASGYYYLAEDITATSSITVASGAEVTLCLGGNTLDMGDYYITVMGTLTICDCHEALEEQGTLTSANNSYAVYVYGTLNVSGGTIVSTYATYATVYTVDGSAVNVSGGKITGKTGIRASGQLTVSGSANIVGQMHYGINIFGTAQIEGGTVFGEYAGLYVYGGSATVNGGSISSNRYGLYSFTVGSTTEINGGSIHGEEDGIYIQNGSVVVNGGYIDGANGIYGSMSNTNELTVNGGEIVGISYGIHGCTKLTITGGTVKGDYGIWHTNSTFIMKGDALVESTGTGQYAQAIHCADAEISGGTIRSAGGYALAVFGKCYLWGTPVIEGSESRYADLYCSSNTVICPSSPDGAAKYEGESLTLSASISTSANNSTILTGVDGDTRAKFSLINSVDTVLVDGTDENEGDVFAHKHIWSSDWSSDAAAHWYACTAEGCPITDYSTVTFSGCKYTAHYAPRDDKDCTTDIACATCKYVFTYGNSEHGYDNACDTTCNNAGCTAGNRTTSHVPDEDDGDCTTEIHCTVCNEITTAANTHSYLYTTDGAVITEKCANDGCTVHTETVTIEAPTGTLTYDGTTEFKSTVVYSDGWAGAKSLEIIYTRAGAPTNDLLGAGAIKASITVDTDKTATVSYTVAKANKNAPTGIGKTDTSFIDTVDGKITGVTTAMEYKLSTEADYTAVNGTEITELASGTYYVRLAETDNYNASDYVTVTINKGGLRTATITNISDAGKTYNNIAVTNPEYTYDGDGTVTVKWYNDNGGAVGDVLASAPVNAGTYWVGISASAGDTCNAVAEVTKQFVINPLNISEASIALGEALTYNGKEQTKDVISVKVGTLEVTTYTVEGNKATDYSLNGYTLTVTGTGNFTGTRTATWSIGRLDISNAEITLLTLTYNGKVQDAPISSVKVGDIILTESDYSILGTTATAGAGTHSSSLHGKGNFRGSKAFEWTVTPLDISAATIFLGTAPTYNGAEQTQSIVNINVNGVVVNSYTVEGDKQVDVGASDYTLTVTGTGNFTGTASASWNILPLDIKDAEITLGTAPTYNGAEQTMPITSVKIDGLTVTYTTSGDKATNVGATAYELTVTGNGNFTGTAKKAWNIEKARAEISVDTTAIVKTFGEAWTLPVASSSFGTPVANYTVGEMANANVYSLTFTVTGTDNYYGDTVSISVTINKAKVTKPTADSTVFTYNGNAQTYNLATNSLYTISGNVQTDADEYTVTVSLNDKNNYEWADGSITDLTYEFNIAQKSINGATVTLGTSLTYNGGEQTQTVVSVVIDGLTATFDVAGNRQTDVGATDYKLTVTGNGNFSGTQDKAWNIAKANAVITVDQTDIVKTFGEAWTLPVAASTFGTPTASLTLEEMKNADTYTLTFTVAGTNNYNGDSKSINVTVNKATYDMSGIAFESKTVKYDGTAHSLSITGKLPNGVSVSYQGNANTNAGAWTVTATFTGDQNNYNAIAPMSATLTINQAQIVDHIGEGGGNPNVVVTTENGFAPNVEVVVTELDKANVGSLVTDNDTVGAVYDIIMKSNGVTVQPDGSITVRILIPTELRDVEFRILQNLGGTCTVVEYKINGDYAVFTTDKLSEFLFVHDNIDNLGWLVTVLIVSLAAEIALAFLLFAIIEKQKGANKGKKVRMAGFAPLTFMAAIVPGTVAASVALLGVAAAAVGVLDIALGVTIIINRKNK